RPRRARRERFWIRLCSQRSSFMVNLMQQGAEEKNWHGPHGAAFVRNCARHSAEQRLCHCRVFALAERKLVDHNRLWQSHNAGAHDAAANAIGKNSEESRPGINWLASSRGVTCRRRGAAALKTGANRTDK